MARGLSGLRIEKILLNDTSNEIFLNKDWSEMKSTKVYSKFLIMKSSEIIINFLPHFSWLYGPWKLYRVLKKYLFWKYDSWFPKSCQNSLRQNSPEMMHEKKCFWLTLCCSFWSSSGNDRIPKPSPKARVFQPSA